MTSMVPATLQSHHRSLLCCPVPSMIMGHKRGLPKIRMQAPLVFRKAEPEEYPPGKLAFLRLRWGICCLKTLLCKVMERCQAIMKVLRSAVTPAQAGKFRALGPLDELGDLGPERGSREQERGPAGVERNWGLNRMDFSEEEVCEGEISDADEAEVLVTNLRKMGKEDDMDAEKTLTPEMKMVERGDAPLKEVELELSDWLDWESEDENLSCDSAPGTCFDLTPSRRGREAQSPSTDDCLSSEGEPEEEVHSDSDWDEDDDSDWDVSSEVDSELWESLGMSADPYNPFRLSSPAGKTRDVVQVEERSKATPVRVKEGEEKNEGEGKRDKAPDKRMKTDKKVKFSDEVVVHPLVEWRFASQAARDGSCWIQMAVDRERFKGRIQVASDIISPVLQANHRAIARERCLT
ncbi:hypothetical protein GJAV_G00252070 [Gymnothorax javanicus]|nr:hypothetical protein GJAV_G00252070 [Gymnothorax javanicus]